MLVELQNNSSQRTTVGADKAYDAKNFIKDRFMVRSFLPPDRTPNG